MKVQTSLLAVALMFSVAPSPSQAGLLSKILKNPIKTGGSSSNTTLNISGNGLGSACGSLQPLVVYNQAANYQIAFNSQQTYLNSMIANEVTQNAWNVTQRNDFYLQANAESTLELIKYKLDVIASGAVGNNASISIPHPGGSFALDTDIMGVYAGMSGREFSVPDSNSSQLKVLRSSIGKILANKNPGAFYDSFVYTMDYANRIERAVAALRSYGATGSVDFNKIQPARRFLCQGAYPTTIKAPSAAEYTSMSPYVRAVYKAALTVTGELSDLVGSLNSSQKSQIDSADAEAGI